MPDSVYIVDKMTDYIEETGMRATPEMIQHLTVIHKALHIYNQRSKTRGELWARFDVHDSFAHARSKLARIGAMLQHAELNPTTPRTTAELEVLNDEIIDLINYAAFMYRHVNPGLKPRVEPIDL
jgi:hypothetical protein